MVVGENLKQVRIRRNITLFTVSKILNISIIYLEAIENDEFSKTPGGVYTIGFIRTYADYLNLDSNEIINTYKNQISLSESSKSIELPKPLEAFNPMQFTTMISLLAVVSISIVFYFMFIDRSNLQPEYAITSKIPEDLESLIEKYEVESALSKIKNINNEKNLKENHVSEVALLNNTKNTISESQITVKASKPKDIDKDGLKSLISLKVINSTWIQLRNIKDIIVFSKLMDKDEVYNYSIKDDLVITTGNAGNIIVSIGGEIMGKLGKKGEVLDLITISSDYFSN
tara:strand:+ start:28 stop:885 length:858 start_codon:yes stop_codon:yes gene_type:complete